MTARSKRALLLGAGFSAEFGLPLTWHLTAELKNWLTPAKLRSLNKGWIEQGGGYHNSVIEDACRLLRNQQLHYENILGNLQTRYNQVDRGFREQFHSLYVWLTEMIYWLLYYRHVKNERYFKASIPFYDGLKILVAEESPLWIFSLNHDSVVEMLAGEWDIPLGSGFSSEIIRLPRRDSVGNKIGELEFAYLSREELDKGAFNYLPDGTIGINLLKLHGALDVFGFQDKLNYLKLCPNSKGVAGTISALRAANIELIFLNGGKPFKVTNEIAYADEAGEMQFLRRTLLAGAYKFDNRISQNAPPEFLNFFENRLNYFTSLVTIGYNLSDLHINKIISNWLEFTDERKLTIVKPTKNLPEVFKHLSPQVEVIQTDTTGFLDSFHKSSRPISQRVAKSIRSSSRRFLLWKRGF
jgi:hypothetical protein